MTLVPWACFCTWVQKNDGGRHLTRRTSGRAAGFEGERMNSMMGWSFGWNIFLAGFWSHYMEGGLELGIRMVYAGWVGFGVHWRIFFCRISGCKGAGR